MSVSNDHGLLVVRRTPLPNVTKDRRPPLGLDYAETNERYRGIDGEIWPDVDTSVPARQRGMVSLDGLTAVLRYRDSLAGRVDVLYCQFHEPGKQALTAPKGFQFVGFDLASLVSEWNCYSVLFNEILLGSYDELRSYATKVNEHLLLPDTSILEQVSASRSKLSAEGADLEAFESGEEASAIAVYLLS